MFEKKKKAQAHQATQVTFFLDDIYIYIYIYIYDFLNSWIN